VTDLLSTTQPSPGAVPYGRRIRELAASHPDAPAVITAALDGTERVLSWRELEDTSNQLARVLAERGVDHESMVVIGLPNGPEHYLWTSAAWKLGACALALNPRMPTAERDAVLELARATIVVSTWDDVAGLAADPSAGEGRSTDPMQPDLVARPGRAVASGGSTGRPKIIVLPAGMEVVPGDTGGMGEMGGMQPEQVQLVPGPLYHNMPHGWSYIGLMHDHTLVVMERFDAALAVDLIERHRVSFSAVVPTHMSRIAKLPDIDQRDLSSIQAILHSAAVCPAWLKRRWIELIGPEKVHEGFGATEAVGLTVIRGDEWLEHPGSVGRPVGCDLRILDEDGNELPPGEVGEIFTRPHSDVPTYDYIGSARAKSTEDGFVSVGDLGWVDEEGYLFVADRRVDLIISGGSNIYPAEVEAALLEHPSVGDVAVIGLSDPDWGRRVHAIVQLRDGHAADEDELRSHCKQRVASYKVPKSIEFVEALPRNDAGKLRRSDLVAEREAAPASAG